MKSSIQIMAEASEQNNEIKINFIRINNKQQVNGSKMQHIQIVFIPYKPNNKNEGYG